MNGTQTSLPLSAIAVQPGFNPRRFFDQAELDELAESIKLQGVIQPIAVRPVPDEGGKYWLIAGERRFRSAQAVGLAEIPVIIHDCGEREALAMATAENLRRANISPAEESLVARRVLDLENGDEAEAIRRLGWTLQKFKARVALLHATDEVMQALAERRIKLGHAELLATLPATKQTATLKTIIERDIPVEALQDQMKKVTIPLASACFDTAGCAGCPHNSSSVQDLFGAHAGDAKCSNRECFNAKTDTRLVELRGEKQKEYPLVFFDREKQASSYTFLVERGKGGVGPEQYVACRGCKDYGALLSTAPGKKGAVICDTTCFNTACNKQMQAAYQESLREDAQTEAAEAAQGAAPSGGAGKAAAKKATPAKKKHKKKAKAAGTPAAVNDQYHAFACREAAALLDESEHARQVMATWAMVEKSDDDDLKSEAFGEDGHVGADDALTALWSKDAATLSALSLKAMKHLLLKPTQALLDGKEREKQRKLRNYIPSHVDGPWVKASQLFVRQTAVKVDEKFCVNRAVLEAHTKSGLEALLTEAGFSTFYDEKHKDDKGKTFKALLSKKHPEIVDAALDSGFEFKGFVPAGLAESLAEPSDKRK